LFLHSSTALYTRSLSGFIGLTSVSAFEALIMIASSFTNAINYYKAKEIGLKQVYHI
jgi:hypothetical protein